MKGYIHSFESFGTKDGPGIRFVLFMQGCPLRCLYCHNPDTWGVRNKKLLLTPAEVFDEIQKVKGFIRSGGVTVSGGEPLMQAYFVRELFQLCREAGIHTAIDTSGHILNPRVKDALEYTDLVLLDVKHIDPDKYKQLTSVPLQPTLRFIDHLASIGKDTWLRYVLVPGYSDDPSDLQHWAEYIARYRSIIKRVDVLPFHQMGMHKWQEVDRAYALKDVPTPTREAIQYAEEVFRSSGLPVA